MKILLRKTDFVYYSNHSFKKKQGIELFNLYFKEIPYYLFFTNLKEDTNKKRLVEILDVFRENIDLDLIKDNFVFVVVDNEKVNLNFITRIIYSFIS
jgi:hypothetical protein